MTLPYFIRTGDGEIVFAGIDGDMAVWTQDVSHDRYAQTVIGWQVTHEPGENTWHISVADCARAIGGLLIDLSVAP